MTDGTIVWILLSRSEYESLKKVEGAGLDSSEKYAAITFEKSLILHSADSNSKGGKAT